MSDNSTFTSNQVQFIEWLATPKSEREVKTQVAFSEILGVNDKTLTRWKTIDGFGDAVITRARELLGASLPEVYGALRQEAIKGSFQHIKLVMELTGEYTEQTKLQVSTSGIMIDLNEPDAN